MLMDILGTLIGFVAVILLLSLIVTAIVQIIENLVHIRARNLRLGLEWIIEKYLMRPDCAASAEVATTAAASKDPKALSREILERASINCPDRLAWLRRFVNQPITWIEPVELEQILGVVGFDTGARHAIVKEFKRVGDQLSKRFAQIMRIVTAVVAVLVAFLFQLSSPDLLGRLSSDPEFRSQMVAIGEELGGEKGRQLQQALAYEDVSETALDRLKENHPDLAAQIEEAAGIGDDRADVVSELRLILEEEAPARADSVVQEYEDLLDGLRRQKISDARAAIGETSSLLAQVNIVPWPVGWSYYKDVRHCLGVLATIVLLSLGAPFWYEMLRNLLKLRDVLQPKKEKEAKG